MIMLAVSNLTHRKVRSGLSILAVAIAITLLLILVGLSNGTLNEVSNRMQSVDAEIVVRDKHFDLGSISGGKLWEKEIAAIAELQIDSEDAVEKVIPVFLGRMKVGGLSQNVFGIHPEDFACFAGRRKMLAGDVFSDIANPADGITENMAAKSMQIIIDERLSKAAGLGVGDSTTYGDTTARIVGVVETGVAGRVFAPINMLRGANGISGLTAHMFFIKAKSGLATEQLQQLCEKIETATRRTASLVANYGQVLAANFRNLTIFVNVVSLIGLVICFLFILVTMYTMVLERGKEIAILQSLGAGQWDILRQTIQEALLICSMGTAAGIAMAYGGRWLIETLQPLMTIEISAGWLLIAAALGLGGGVLSSVYPGYLALRHDPVEALSFE